MDARLPTRAAPTISCIAASSPFPLGNSAGIPTMGHPVARVIQAMEAPTRRKRRTQKEEAGDVAEHEEEEAAATELEEGVDTPQADLPSPCRGVAVGTHLRFAAGR